MVCVAVCETQLNYYSYIHKFVSLGFMQLFVT